MFYTETLLTIIYFIAFLSLFTFIKVISRFVSFVLYFLRVLCVPAFIFWSTKHTKCHTKFTKKVIYRFPEIIFKQALSLYIIYSEPFAAESLLIISCRACNCCFTLASSLDCSSIFLSWSMVYSVSSSIFLRKPVFILATL